MSDQSFQFTLKFDTEDNTLQPEQAINVKDLSKLLVKMHNALNIQSSEDDIFLADIKSNCYALQFSTPSLNSKVMLEQMHSSIADNNYRGFNHAQKNYTLELQSIIHKNKLVAEVYNADKTYLKRIRNIELKDTIRLITENDTVVGKVTKIGSTTLAGNSVIHITNFDRDIVIPNDMEKVLLSYYKNQSLRFEIRKTYELKSKKITHIELLDFNTLGDKGFNENVKIFIKNFGERLYEQTNKLD